MYEIINTTIEQSAGKKRSVFFLLTLCLYGALFFFTAAPAEAAVSHSTSTESHTAAVGNTSAASFSWSHTEAGSPAGVLVFVSTLADADYISSVTYGGVTMTQVSEAIDTAGEPARMTAFFLGSGVPTGNQTVVVNRTNNATEMYATVTTVQASRDTETVDYVLFQDDGVFGEQSVDDGSFGSDSVRYASAYSGVSNVLTAGANSTVINSIDFGLLVSTLGRETVAGQGARNVGLTSASDDRAGIYLAVREKVNFSGILYTDAGVTPAAAGKTIKMAIGTSTPSVYSTTTATGGTWFFAIQSDSNISTTTPVTIWLDGDANDATTLIQGYASSSVSGIPLYYAYTLAYGTSTTANVNLSNFSFYDNVSDTDILYTSTGASTTIASNFTIKQGVFVASTTLTIAGNYTNNATFTHNSGEVILSGATTTASGTMTGTSAFNNLTISSAGTKSIEMSASTTNLTVNSGAIIALSNSLSISGNLTNNGTFSKLAGITWATSTSAQSSWDSVTYGNGLFVAVGYFGTGTRAMRSTDGITWATSTSASDNRWECVTYGNGLFVAVSSDGTGNRVMTSPDGITWTSRTSAADNSWISVTYGNGLFVAVAQSGTGNRVMTSPDGITWTSRTSAADNFWKGVTYGNGLFVAVSNTGTGNRVMRSTDGIAWATSTSATDNWWYSVTYGNGLFVAVSTTGTGDRVMTSPDGITWTSRVTNDNSWQSVIYNNGLFVAVAGSGSSGARVMTSLDGITWTSRNTPADLFWYSVTYGNGLFVAVSLNGGSEAVMTSSFGTTTFNGTSAQTISGSLTNTNTLGNIFLTASGSKTFQDNASTSNFLIDASSGAVTAPAVLSITGNYTNSGTFTHNSGEVILSGFTSTATGTLTGTSAFNNLTITGSGTKNIAMNASTTNLTVESGVNVALPTNLSISGNLTNNGTLNTAGITWTSRTSAADNQWLSVTYGNGLFVAVADTGTGNRVMTSPDGVTWTSRNAAVANGWGSVTYGNGLFVAVSYTGTGNRVMTSPDGITWTSRTSAANNQWQSVTYGNGLFVAVSDSGTTNRVMTSPDGITWTSRTTNDNFWYSVTYGNGLFVAVSYSGTGNRVMTSPDGITWTLRTSAVDNMWQSVVYGNGLFVAVSYSGTGNRVMTSPDGITWTSRTSAADNQWRSVTYGNGLFVAVADTGTTNRVMTSPDGITWTSRNVNTNSYLTITYGNSLFVAVSYTGTGNRVMTSSLGTTTFNGTSAQTISGSLTNTNTFGDVIFTAAGTKTFQNNASTSNFLIQSSSGAVTAPAVLSISGNYTNNATFTHNSGTVYLIGTTTTVTGTMTGTSAFNNLTVTGTGTMTIAMNASTTDLTVGAGATVVAPANLSISGNFTNNGTFTHNSGTTTFTGASKTINGNLTSSSSLNNVSISGSYTVSATNASTSNLTIQSGGSFTSPTNLSITGNFSNSGTFNSNEGNLYLASVAATQGPFNYLSGRDSSGSATGIGGVVRINAMAISGNYLYVGGSGDATACSQAVGSAIGCELQVYNISSSTNPVYVAGRDISGSNTGTQSIEIYDLTVSGNYLYIVSRGNGTSCSQVAGSAVGCEIQVYNISSSTNPVYVAGRDADGTTTGITANALLYHVTVSGNYLYIGGGYFIASTCAAPATWGCEIQVYDISSSTNPTYVAGRDISGSASGSANTVVNDLTISGSYLYVGSGSSVTACAQTAGSSTGCEFQVYDISSSTNPTYVAGRDISGSTSGTSGSAAQSIAINGNYLYLGGAGTTTACAQTAGSAAGCELQVYDISSPTNPTYVAGRDADGSATGVEANPSFASVLARLAISGNYLYVGNGSSTTACAQTAGSAAGCELQVYDISSPTNPIYTAGKDANGSATGTSALYIIGVATDGSYLYVGKDLNATACSQTSGSAIGCELMVFNLYTGTASSQNVLSGNLTGNSALANVLISGAATFASDASTTNFTIQTSASTTAPTNLSISGNLTNSGGTFAANGGLITLTGTNQTISTVATTTFHSLTKIATSTDTLTFTAGEEYEFAGTLTLAGTAGNLLLLRSSASGTYWYIDPQATTTVSYLNVQDSNNVNVSTVTCSTGCIDGTRNVNWSFEGLTPAATISSAAVSNFYVGQATTTLSTLTITEDATTPSIASTTDLRIVIATTTTNFRFDTNTTTLTFDGTASSKIATSTVAYENEGAVLVIDVTSNFTASDTLMISGIAVGSFASVSSAASYLTLQTDGNSTGTPAATDTAAIHVTGTLTLANHTLGQVSNEFSVQNKTDTAFFAFNLTPASENATITDLIITLSGVHDFSPSNLINLRLYQDKNNNQTLDGGDTLLDNSGIITVNGQDGAITFSADFSATTTTNYLVIANTVSINRGGVAIFSITTNGVTAVGSTSNYASVVLGGASNVQHLRSGNGAGGSSARIGDAAPAGAGVVVGGGNGGGNGADAIPDGENITPDSDFFKPTTTGTPDNEWTNGNNAYDSDGVYATAATTNLKQSYANFGFGIPTGNTIQGLAVKLDVSGTTADGTIDVSISWDGGSSYTTAKATPTLSGSDLVYTVGGNADTWGRTWSESEFSAENFRLRVSAQPVANTIHLDALEIRVFHQTGGGGAGGGVGGGRI